MNPYSLLRRWGLSGALVVTLAACQTATTTQFPSPGADWKNAIGQLQYVTPKRSVIGEAVVARHGEKDFQLDYTAGPGVPLIRLRESGDSASAEGVFARMGWHGSAARPPHPLASWVALRDVFAQIDATRMKQNRVAVKSPTGAWNAVAELTAGKLQRVRVEFPRTSERFNFVFAR